jgi:tetratricopeptide (TPR) repeat protein
VLELIKETTDSPELTQLLLQLFLQLGDEARAWQLALSFIDSSDELSAIAIDVLEQLADGEFALPQQITLTEVHLLRAEYERAFAVLDGLEKSSLEGLGRDAARLAEAMLFTGVGPQAREWLVEYYRLIGDESLAADHTVWALASGQQLPTDWIHQKASGDMLFRSGQLRELEGDLEAAKHQYLQGCKDGAAEEYILAAMRLRLAQLAENDGDLEQAQQQIGIALEILPESELLKQRAKHLATALSFKRIEKLRSSADSVENTVEIARLLCAVGKPAEAITELQNGISRGQASPEISAELGDCFILQGDYRIALRVLSDTAKRLEDSPDKTDLRLRALYSMAKAHEFLKEPDDSIRCLEQILVLKQDYRDSRAKLEELYANKSKGSRAPHEPAAEAADSTRDEIVSEILGMLGVSDEANDEGSES